jgi:8-oxo-dGTP pyrophosphatase MutT (NUDIX family)
MTTERIVRPSARVVLIDAQDRVFFFRSDGVFDHDAKVLWVPPGGGLEEGETYEKAALRELWEETGLVGAELSPCVWLRTWYGNLWETPIESREQYFICRVDSHEIVEGHINPDQLERHSVTGYRWWSAEEMAGSPDLFVPRDILALLPAILRGELPPEPLVVY